MRPKKKNKIEKRNDLNELRANNMTLQQLRFLSIYLSLINARDVSTRLVRFLLSDFQKIMELGKLNMKNLKATTDSLLQQIVHIPEPGGGYRSFQLFKRCRVFQENYEWYVEIDAHDEALPLFFEFKEKYFIYNVENILRLSSSNQIRMYEILKQRQKMVQPVVIQMKDLREMLGIRADAYSEYKDFRRWVLDKAQQELSAQTDITFTYEPIRTRRKVTALAFTIEANTANSPQMSIPEWLNTLPEPEGPPEVKQISAASENTVAPMEDVAEDEDDESVEDDDILSLYADALPPGMTKEQIDALRILAWEHIGGYSDRHDAELKIFSYLQNKTRLMMAQKKAVKPENYFGWLRKAVDRDWK